jgi:hypothetical protein
MNSAVACSPAADRATSMADRHGAGTPSRYVLIATGTAMKTAEACDIMTRSKPIASPGFPRSSPTPGQAAGVVRGFECNP